MKLNCYLFKNGSEAYLLEGGTIPIFCSLNQSFTFDTKIWDITEIEVKQLKCTYKQWYARIMRKKK